MKNQFIDIGSPYLVSDHKNNYMYHVPGAIAEYHGDRGKRLYVIREVTSNGCGAQLIENESGEIGNTGRRKTLVYKHISYFKIIDFGLYMEYHDKRMNALIHCAKERMDE